MKLIGSKIIETERLILRPTIESDLFTLWSILGIPDVNKYYLVGKYNTDWEKELPWQLKKLKRANDNDVFQWSIVLKDNMECIGQISVQENGPDLSVRDIGWFINPNYQRKGYAFEAASVVLDYMFNEVDIKSIETGSAICNPASYKLMEKLGFVKSDIPDTYAEYTFGGKELIRHYHLDQEILSNNKTKKRI